MIRIIVLALFIAECTSCKNQTQCLLEDPFGWLVPTSGHCSTDNGKHIEYILYTPDGKQTINSTSVLNNTKPIKLIFSGHNANGDTPIINIIIDQYLKVHGYKYHVIAPDYKGYFSQVAFYCNLTSVTIGVSRFLHELVLTNDIDPKNMHIVSSSLGTQVAGIVGSIFKQLSNQTIGRITALDPPSMGFTCLSFPKCRLDKTSATFVDVIITTNMRYNSVLKNGHTDFIVNNLGQLQPGCEVLNIIEAIRCSHLRSNEIFAESIELNNLRGHCLLSTDDTDTDEDVVYMGEYCREQPKCDTYKVITKGEPPFGIDPSGPIS